MPDPFASRHGFAHLPDNRQPFDLAVQSVQVELLAKLPTTPLALRGLTTVPLDLETTYATTCQDSRISP